MMLEAAVREGAFLINASAGQAQSGSEFYTNPATHSTTDAGTS
jgi:hypothetical protein